VLAHTIASGLGGGGGGRTREAIEAAYGEQLARLWLEPLGRVYKHEPVVGGGERAVRVLREVRVPGRVEQVDLQPGV
jgi:hypothetical protein